MAFHLQRGARIGIFAAVNILFVQSIGPKASVSSNGLPKAVGVKCGEIIENSPCIINSNPWSPDQN